MRTKNLSDSEVLRLALGVIIDRGPESFTLKEVSKKTNLAAATLLQRFKSKDRLLLEALKQANEDFMNSSKQNLSRWKNQGLKGVVEFLSSFTLGIHEENMSEHVALLAKDFADPRLHNMARSQMSEIRNTLRSILDGAQEKGELRPDVEMNQLVFDLEALWHGSMIQWGFLKRGSIRTWVEERLCSFLEC